MRPAAKAITALLGGVVAYNIACEDGETISECCDDILSKYPIVGNLVMLAIYLHVANKVPPPLDPIHGLFLAARWTRQHLLGETRRG